MKASDYAHALYELGGKKEHLSGLKKVLARRGHTKLLPSIFSEYKKIVLYKERLEAHKADTPQRRRTRTLLELYRALVS